MIEQIVWYLGSIRSFIEAAPLLRALIICLALYQLDLVAVLAAWLMRKAGLLPGDIVLEPANRKDGLVVLPTLLRKRGELEGLIGALRSVAQNGYPGRLHVVACIDGRGEAGVLFDELVTWIAAERVPPGVTLHAVATRERAGKAVAMDEGVEYLKRLVARGEVDHFPELFFNMDADSELAPRALERMVYRLTRRRRLTGRPFHIVTSNVIVPFDQCWRGARTLLTLKGWIALSVAREYVGSISAGKVNWKLSPTMEVSGALYCTWSEIYLAAPRYAAFIQTLRLRDWLKWWVGCAPPQFAAFDGPPLPEALTGPGDDTWMGWFACCCGWRKGRISAELPRTPLHALGRLLLQYVSRPVAYDPLAKVYSKTPTTVRALFKQRLRWNSSRMQDLLRHGPSLAYHWQAGVPLMLGTITVFTAITLFASAPLVWAGILGRHAPPPGPAFAVLAVAGYYLSRVVGTVLGLLISDSPRREWIKLLAVPVAVPYHVVFNTLTLLIGYYRDAFGFGEPTTFAPERTLLRSNLTRFAVAYRIRRALLLAVRSAAHGDVPLGSFWFGWGRTPFTPSGFDGWSSGKVPPPVSWPRRPVRRPRAEMS
ncbi:MAG TPA: glycosyltransferase family 2 protein [Polyangia bacterium]|nr:glycosyltransferase family 2 protein [Polyangia bacterium]